MRRLHGNVICLIGSHRLDIEMVANPHIPSCSRILAAWLRSMLISVPIYCHCMFLCINWSFPSFYFTFLLLYICDYFSFYFHFSNTSLAKLMIHTSHNTHWPYSSSLYTILVCNSWWRKCLLAICKTYTFAWARDMARPNVVISSRFLNTWCTVFNTIWL